MSSTARSSRPVATTEARKPLCEATRRSARGCPCRHRQPGCGRPAARCGGSRPKSQASRSFAQAREGKHGSPRSSPPGRRWRPLRRPQHDASRKPRFGPRHACLHQTTGLCPLTRSSSIDGCGRRATVEATEIAGVPAIDPVDFHPYRVFRVDCSQCLLSCPSSCPCSSPLLTWPRPSRISLPLKLATRSGCLDGSARSPRAGIGPR